MILVGLLFTSTDTSTSGKSIKGDKLMDKSHEDQLICHAKCCKHYVWEGCVYRDIHLVMLKLDGHKVGPVCESYEEKH